MSIGGMFERSIKRSINGVIKADQKDDANVWQELDDRHRHQLGYGGHDVHLDGDQNVMIVEQAHHARSN